MLFCRLKTGIIAALLLVMTLVGLPISVQAAPSKPQIFHIALVINAGRIQQEAVYGDFVKVYWNVDKQEEDEIKSFHIYRNGIYYTEISKSKAKAKYLDKECFCFTEEVFSADIGKTYTYQVRALGKDGYLSDYSNQKKVLIEAEDKKPPTAPSGLVVKKLTGDSLTIKLTRPSLDLNTSTINTRQIWFKQSPFNNVYHRLLVNGNEYAEIFKGDTFTLKNLPSNKTLNISVVGYDNKGNPAYSKEYINVKTLSKEKLAQSNQKWKSLGNLGSWLGDGQITRSFGKLTKDFNKYLNNKVGSYFSNKTTAASFAPTSSKLNSISIESVKNILGSIKDKLKL